MVLFTLNNAIVATCIGADFFLTGNALTQSLMTLPALIQDFPPRSSPDHAVRSRLLGAQWPVCWVVGNRVMRPLSTLTTLGYAYTAWQLRRNGGGGVVAAASSPDWRMVALNALLHATVIVHSAVTMQPLNDRIAGLAGLSSSGSGIKAAGGGGDSSGESSDDAVELATAWIRGNYYRAAVPFATGVIAMWQLVFSGC